MGPACGLVAPGMYPASSGDPGECRDEEAADETQTTESRVELYLFRLETSGRASLRSAFGVTCNCWAVTTEFYYAQLLHTFYILTMFLC
jgi:hypothetical protein